tara:strand:+ start:369 stop:1232 length:864 start_codon:yes stop_codon:yes gene_type:complete
MYNIGMLNRLKRSQLIWLLSLLGLVILMVMIGGITRLTGSGLSMVEWNLIMGSLPPLSDSQWVSTFSKYQLSPEYQQINKGMSLSQFKFIFFWEYLHRMLGRLIGLVCIVPYLYFLLKGHLSSVLKKRGVMIIFLVIAQGLLGWYMVKSGLVNIPHVSHYRLASHLSLAFFFFVYILWTFLDEINLPKFSKDLSKKFFSLMSFFLFLLGLQIVYGAFTAGLKAGHMMNTFPLMAGQFVPDLVYTMSPFWKNFIENPFGIQFIHRWLGICVFALGVVLSYQLLKEPSP